MSAGRDLKLPVKASIVASEDICFIGVSSSVDGTCPGDDITFLCVTSDTTIPFTWPVTSAEGNETACLAFPSGTVTFPTCGPMDRFTVSISEDGSNSTLSVQSVDDILNGTRVQCAGGDVDEEICVIRRSKDQYRGYECFKCM